LNTRTTNRGVQCENDLGYLKDYKSDTRAILECVEEQIDEDFGELTFDDSGRPTDEGRQTLRAAMNHQDHQPWEACQDELGIQTFQGVISDK
jgi:hypothetical protein